MLKGVTNVGQVLLGLSKVNLRRLKEGKPIQINLAEMGLPDQEIIIFFGQTERDMHKQLVQAGLVTPESKVNVDPRLGDDFDAPKSH